MCHRRERCLACDGVHGRRIEHTCGRSNAPMSTSMPAKEIIDHTDKANWVNGKIHPAHIPIFVLIRHYKANGVPMDLAVESVRTTAQMYRKEHLYDYDINFENNEATKMLIQRICDLWNDERSLVV